MFIVLMLGMIDSHVSFSVFFGSIFLLLLLLHLAAVSALYLVLLKISKAKHLSTVAEYSVNYGGGDGRGEGGGDSGGDDGGGDLNFDGMEKEGPLKNHFVTVTIDLNNLFGSSRKALSHMLKVRPLLFLEGQMELGSL
jgi:hypothetical protein